MTAEPAKNACESETGRIYIPPAFRRHLLQAFKLSVRLGNVLAQRNLSVAGDLHGLDYAEILDWQNCGAKTLKELQNLIKLFQLGSDENATAVLSPILANPSLLVVPKPARNLKLTELPLSVRLEKVLLKFGYQSLGDLNGVNVEHLLSAKNCGRQSIRELKELVRRAGSGEFLPVDNGDPVSNIREIISSIERGMAKLSGRDRKIYEGRLSGADGAPRTLEAVGSDFQLTRERTRQIVQLVNEKIRRTGGPRLARAMKAIARECQKIVCPLTPGLFAQWLQASPPPPRPPQFYVCVVDLLDQTVPAWSPESSGDDEDEAMSLRVEDALEAWMRPGGLRPTIQQAYSEIRRHSPHRNLSVKNFLGALRRSREILVDFSEPHLPVLHLRRSRMKVLEFARAVLESSPKPLTYEKIVEQARARFGEESIDVCIRGMASALTAERGFLLLGPCTRGLAKHLKVPLPRRRKFCNRFEGLLKRENRPFLTTEVAENRLIPGFEGINPHEMAQILREDGRFTDLGRRWFALRKPSRARVKTPVSNLKSPIPRAIPLRRIKRAAP